MGRGDRDPQARLVLRHGRVGDGVQEEAAVLDLLRHRENPRVVVDHHRHDLRVGFADVDALLGEPPAQERHVAPQLRAQVGSEDAIRSAARRPAISTGERLQEKKRERAKALV